MPNNSVLKNNHFPITLSWGNQTLSVGALIDSGADDCLIDHEFAIQAGIPLSKLPIPLSVQALNGNLLGKVTQQTASLSLITSGNHSETIRFKTLHHSSAPVVLGRPWLIKHDPLISWASGEIKAWGKSCFLNCLRSATPPSNGACRQDDTSRDKLARNAADVSQVKKLSQPLPSLVSGRSQHSCDTSLNQTSKERDPTSLRNAHYHPS